MRNLFLISLFFFSVSFSAQQDFTWLKIKPYRVANLSDSLRETSGLEFYRQRLLTHNDSGNSSELFVIDPDTGDINKKIKTAFTNVDWEAIASDSAHIYIGDFGNNGGSRKDLAIYQVPINSADPLEGRKINFYYPEQTGRISQNIRSDFDAEAMIVLNGKIHLFTKEWHSKATTHYIIDPQIKENQPAQKMDTFSTGFLVTDAAYFQSRLYLVGYTKKAEVFMSIFTESRPGVFFEQPPHKFYLGSALSVGQVEGVAVNEKGIYISAEILRLPVARSKPSLFFIPHAKLK